MVLNDVVPANTRFVSFTAPAGWTTITPPPGGTGAVSATIPSLPGLTSATFVLVVNVDIGTSSGTTITNTAVVSGDIDDMDPANNSATATTTVAAVGAPRRALAGGPGDRRAASVGDSDVAAARTRLVSGPGRRHPPWRATPASSAC